MMTGGAPAYLGIWVAMTAAMMLPSSAPMLLLVDRLSHSATPPFALGYVATWAAAGIAAYVATSRLHWHAAAAALVAAGLYQLVPLRHACLQRCRNPLAFLRAHASEPPFLVGARHGAFCVGCCAGLMVLLLVVGMTSAVWMGVVGLAMLVEKTAPHGERLALPTAAALVTAGVWAAL
jgi:predicted metal-binding membrane protein